MDKIAEFFSEVQKNIEGLGEDLALRELSNLWMRETVRYKYSYNFTWMGRPIIQYPQDLIAMQEILWKVKPQLIIETGIAHGGGLIFYASMLELMGSKGEVLGIDIDIRKHNRRAIEHHPMSKRIMMIQGSSTDETVVDRVYELARGKGHVLVTLDSNHTHDHVLKELQFYSPLVRKGSYVVVFDTVIENMPEGFFSERRWDKGNNPKTAVREFLKTNDRFTVDKEIESKLLITVAPGGYLKCIKD
jgi:cephalosporin hydroxylase